jgi:AAA15 family ATPase/GTPase
MGAYMLIEFRLSNYRSISSDQTLSLVAGIGAELPQNICALDSDPSLQLVRSAVMYGANAAGKSNLIRALYFMKMLVLVSAKESQQGEEIPVESFLFNKETREQPSQFEIIFSKDKVRYQYGFEVNKHRILEEWLYAYPAGKMQEWFSRKYDKETDRYTWKFSTRNFKGKKELWREATRGNALFLSTAVQLNNEQLLPVFNWFQKDLIVLPAFAKISPEKSIEQSKTELGKERILKYVAIADPNICDISLETETFSEDKISKNFPEDVKEKIKKQMVGKEIVTKIDFLYPENILLDIKDESHGAQKLFAIAGYWIDCLEQGKIIAVDEMDNSLHPLLVRFLIKLFFNPEINKNNSQLIFSTHDTSLLDDDLFRRDQIWFVEKDKHHATQLYPLLDFSPRKDEAIGKGYLQGRYGALPYIGEWRF